MDFSSPAWKAFWRHPFNAKKQRSFRRLHGDAGVFDPEYRPKVSAIVPNFNHAAFLDKRLETILAQTYDNIEVILLDDCSADESRSVIERLARAHPQIRVIFNETNSGNAFKQWRKGLENATGDLIWICESDDYADLAFLRHLVRHFSDPSVTLAFGRIQYCDREGLQTKGLDAYREGAEPKIWKKIAKRPASEWFCNGFGVNNVIANVGGCLFRRQELPDDVWREAQSFSVVGDWYLYAQIAGGGQIVFDPAAVSYFRQHGQNTSVSSFTRPAFYREHQRLMQHLRRKWDIPDKTVETFYGKIAAHHAHFNNGARLPQSLVDESLLLKQRREWPHVLMAFLGFQTGGGEIFPIHLANALHAQGVSVSMMALENQGEVPGVRNMLNPGIPVYDTAWVQRYGVKRFLRDAGISLIHSHVVVAEAFFFQDRQFDPGVPYVVTLHGSYEASGLSDEELKFYASKVDHFIYVADKNLAPLQSDDGVVAAASKFRNAMPLDLRPYTRSRQDMEIAEEAVIFTLVSRAVADKGWPEAIAAFKQLRVSNPDTKMHLLLCGSGEEMERLEPEHGSDPDISFLGFQDRINGLYAMSDCAIVPTRFAGESFPLCIIQALQAGTPVIATKIGEVENLIQPPGQAPAGLLIDFEDDTELFIRGLRGAMERMLDPDLRQRYAAAARTLGLNYDMKDLATDYRRFYETVLGWPHREAVTPPAPTEKVSP
ncbi:MAG: glycosyltransferase [Hyphomicrobium sp.]|uniref:glycosyltransferase n=1 Tax=Hyphomicrobium sp. TaxID=82 RepID=UPI0039E3B27D